MKIKDWDQFQHFKDRNPIWIKLYRTLLDDIEWHKLSGDEAKALVMLWLLASEKNGELPEAKEVAFRLRITETKVKQILTKLSHYVIQSDDSLISDGDQSDALEKRRERDREEKRKKRERLVIAKNALEYLNSKAGKNFKDTETNLSFILERMKEGYELTDFQKAVDNQVTEWKGDEKMNKFLRPSTLFQKSKFDGYVNNNVKPTSDDGYEWGKGLKDGTAQ
jgi:uncharacterized phage protein (TIGR02220 family)